MMFMFELRMCTHKGCFKQAISTVIDGKLEKAAYCLEHSPNPVEAEALLHDYIDSHERIVGLNASGLTFENVDFTDKKFYGCTFQYCNFLGLHSERFRMRISVLDFSIFSNTNLISSNFQYVSFAGSTFSQVLFTGSDLVHNNFNGVLSLQSSFDDSDLYNSRFIRAKLVNTSIRNCNIKKTIFYDIEQENVSFKLSNTREAFFERLSEDDI